MVEGDTFHWQTGCGRKSCPWIRTQIAGHTQADSWAQRSSPRLETWPGAQVRWSISGERALGTGETVGWRSLGSRRLAAPTGMSVLAESHGHRQGQYVLCHLNWIAPARDQGQDLPGEL